MVKTATIEFQVRGYELDGYGHVNHAAYLNYAEYARTRAIEDAGAGADYFQKHGVFPVIARAEVEYKAPCFLADWLRIETTITESARKAVRIFQKIYKRDSNKLAATVLVTLMVVNADGRPVEIPTDFVPLFET